MTRKARLIIDSPRDASTNMSIDEALFRSAPSSSFSATLRLYGWAPRAVSLGRRQKMTEVLKPEICKKEGIEIVKRPGGGAAVYHDKELTYAFVCRLADIPEPPAAVWRELFVSFLDKLGIKADAMGKPGTGGAEACFAWAAEDEPTVNGKKFVGSARRRSRTAFLQHGSILLESQPEVLGRLLRRPEPDNSTGLCDILPGLNLEKISDEFVRAVAVTLGLDFQKGEYVEEEIRLEKGRGYGRL